MMNTYGIYIRADDQGRVVAVNSEGLLPSLDGWVRVGEYESDVPYAQGGAFGEPIMTDGGAWRYKLEDGNVVERSQEEMDADYMEQEPVIPQEERIAKLEASQAIAAIAFVTMAEAGTIDLVTAGEHAEVFAEWAVGVAYAVGQLRRYEDKLYQCVQSHTSQADWTPGAAVSLWVLAHDPAEEWPDWSQPIGAHDAYQKGDKVSHDGKRWISTVDSNVWEPGVYGWEEVKDE